MGDVLLYMRSRDLLEEKVDVGVSNHIRKANQRGTQIYFVQMKESENAHLYDISQFCT